LVSQNGIARPLAPHFLRFGPVTLFLICSSEALDDMLFAGGKLNVKLLGGAQQMADG
jgi:hypothetical protein